MKHKNSLARLLVFPVQIISSTIAMADIFSTVIFLQQIHKIIDFFFFISKKKDIKEVIFDFLWEKQNS